MSLGGGIFTAQNKILPGTYINFYSTPRATAVMSDRGVAAMPFELDWGVEGEIFEVSNSDFYKNSQKIFGYSYNHIKMRNLRELFLHAKSVLCYRMGKGVKASNNIATAKYAGTRGNDITIIVTKDVDNADLYVVETALDGSIKDSQTVGALAELKSNDYVDFKTTGSLAVTAGTPLTEGGNGTVTGEDYQGFLDKLESYTFNILGYAGQDEKIKSLWAVFTKRMRDELGVKFQTVLHDYNKADNYGIISVENDCTNSDANISDLVYWTAGAEAGCAVQDSLANAAYDGELSVDTNYTQSQLAQALESGKLVFHSMNGIVKVLDDINTFVSTSDEFGDEFKSNQTIRVIDVIGTSIANVFNNKYYGKFNNDDHSRIALKNDIVKILESLAGVGAIDNFTSDNVIVSEGDAKKAVFVELKITVAGVMTHLYIMANVA